MVESLKETVHRMLQGRVQHQATPERKKRRQLVKSVGRRQAVKQAKILRLIKKLHADLGNLSGSQA